MIPGTPGPERDSGHGGDHIHHAAPLPLRDRRPAAVGRRDPGPRAAESRSGTADSQGTRADQGFGLRLTQDSIVWLAAVAVAFSLAVLLFTPLHMSLNWDESVYSTQISQHVPIMVWSPERARGVPLLVAPVTLVTGSAVVLRIYLALVAGAGLFLALLAWRGLRPAWVLALAGAIFGGLWAAQAMASQVYPNFWIAVSALAAVGLFLRAATAAKASAGILILLAVAVAFAALMRPTDAAYLCVPLLVATIVVRRWYSLRLLVAIAAGLAGGLGEWLIESYLYFGGPFSRLRAANHAVGGTHFNPVNNLRILSGGRDSSLAKFPGITGWSHPGLLFWWLAFLALAILGIYATGRARGWLFASMPAICALSVYLLYSLPVRDNARYLLPAWALLAIPAADGAAWLVWTLKGQVRLAAIALVAIFLVVELGTQHEVLASQSAAAESTAQGGVVTATALRQLGVHAPCIVTTPAWPNFASTSEPAAFYAGCAYEADMKRIKEARGRQVVILAQGLGPHFRYARQWPAHKMPAGGRIFAYVQPAR